MSGATTTGPVPAGGATAGPEPLNAFILLDYMALVMKEGTKDALAQFDTTTVSPGATGPRSLAALARQYPPNSQAPTGVSRVVQIARANQQLPLDSDAILTVSGVTYVPAQGASLTGIAGQFGVAATAIASIASNPQLSFMPLPAGVTALQLAGPSGTALVPVARSASFQDVARQWGIGATAIDPALIWSNLDVVDRLLVPGQPIRLPAFTRGVTGPQSLLSLATSYKLAVDALALQNADVDLYGPTAAILIPQASRLTVGHLLDRLKAMGFDQKTSGLAGRALLHGLRLPPPDGPSGARKGLYQITGQQQPVLGITAGSRLNLGYDGPTAPAWLRFGGQGMSGGDGPTGAASGKNLVSYPVGVTGMTQIHRLAGATAYSPTGSFLRLDPFQIHPKSYPLAHSITWNVPQNPIGPTGIVAVGSTGSYGTAASLGSTAAPLGNYFVRTFPARLQSLLQSALPAGTAFTLNKRIVEAAGRADSQIITPIAWSTVLEIKIAQVPKRGGGGEPFVYAVQGTTEKEKSILQEILAQPQGPLSIFLLYPANTAQQGQKSATVALVSDPLPSVLLFRTNPSSSTAPGTTAAASAQELLRQIWEVDQVEQPGVYLYYKAPPVNGGTGSLPSYLFGNHPSASVTLLIMHELQAGGSVENPSYVLPPYINSVVLDTATQARSESLFVQSVNSAGGFDPILQTKTPTIHPGTIAFRVQRPNPNYPTPPAPPVTAVDELNELYSIIEVQIPEQDAWTASRPSLPVGPRNPTLGITSAAPPSFSYDVSFPISRLAKVAGPTGATGPVRENDPYAGIGATLTVNVSLLDIFGNTLATEPGQSWLSSTSQPGYTDSVIGIDAWPHTSKTYSVDTTGNLLIELVFDAGYYLAQYWANTAGVNGLIETVAAVRKTYEKVFYQVSQPDMTATVTSNFDPGACHTITDFIRQFVTDCWSSLGILLADLGKVTPPRTISPVSLQTKVPLADTSGDDLFPLTVKIALSRNGKIDPAFDDVPSVQQVISSVAPQTRAAGGKTGKLSNFAKAFEAAFPSFKVATGQSGPESATGTERAHKGIWLVRFAAQQNTDGIYVRLGGTPTYYAPRPVATSLINRPNVSIYRIAPGKTLSQTVTADPNCQGEYCSVKSFTGVDLNVLAQQFLEAMDQALAPEMAAAAAIAAPDVFQTLIGYKANLAGILSGQFPGSSPVPAVYTDAPLPPDGDSAAGYALESELLETLGKLRKIETIIQCPVQSEWKTAPENDASLALYGKLMPLAKQQSSAFSYSSATIRIGRDSATSTLSTLYSINQTQQAASETVARESATFSDAVTFHVTALAHNFRPAVIPEYEQSDWLAFVLPFEIGNGVAAGATAAPPPLPLDIPLPLRAYPTSPALKGQIAVPLLPQFGQSFGATATVAQATQWAYEYSYQYAAAAQDTVSVGIDFNVAGATGYSHSATPGVGVDLAADLLQFKTLYPVLSDGLSLLPLFLKDNSAATPDAQKARLALSSFCDLAGYVVSSWKSWHEYQLTTVYQYEIEQLALPDGPTAAPVLAVQVKEVNRPGGLTGPTSIPLPAIAIDGYLTQSRSAGATTVGPNARTALYTFQAIGASGPALLGWGDQSQHPVRTVRFPGLNVLSQENARAGLGVLRNKDLGRIGGTGDFRPVDPAFIFETPLIKFANVLNPYLDPAGSIFLPNEVHPASATLEGYISALFELLLDGLVSDTTVLVKLAVSYGYTLGEGLPVELPMLLTTPHEYKIAGDPSFVGTVANRIKAWFADRNMNPASLPANAALVFDLTIFSTLSKSQLPILRLREIELPCGSVTWTWS
ncbi:hypothetical protein [Oceanibaculum nanhaiense]|uniref:hypothetical protein n=1 Tax=Oceanibaculum nanhaiense TaxID=1909734 RepID=UPI003F6E8EDC